MNFFTITSELCIDCKECIRICPCNSIYYKDDGLHINNKTCIACGLCYKMCHNNAIKLDIPKCELEEYIVKVSKFDEITIAVDKLTEKVNSITDELVVQKRCFDKFIRSLTDAVVVVNKQSRITEVNNAFFNILSNEDKEKFRNTNSLIGLEFKYFCSAEQLATIEECLNSGENSEAYDIYFGSIPVNVTLISLEKGDSMSIIIKNMMNDNVNKTTIVRNLEDVINRNMSMVQKIGFLLGEEVSETTKIINSTIKSVKRSSDK